MKWKITNTRQFSGLRPFQVAPSSVLPSGVTDYLLPYEKHTIVIRKHPGLFVAHVILLVCACAAASLLTAITNSGVLVLSAAWWTCAIIFLYLIARLAEWLYTYFVVTDTRLIFITGLIARKVITVPIREIHDMELHRSLIGRLLGYGTFNAEPSRIGYRMPRMNYMPYPEQLFLEVVGLLFPDGIENPHPWEHEG